MYFVDRAHRQLFYTAMYKFLAEFDEFVVGVFSCVLILEVDVERFGFSESAAALR